MKKHSRLELAKIMAPFLESTRLRKGNFDMEPDSFAAVSKDTKTQISFVTQPELVQLQRNKPERFKHSIPATLATYLGLNWEIPRSPFATPTVYHKEEWRFGDQPTSLTRQQGEDVKHYYESQLNRLSKSPPVAVEVFVFHLDRFFLRFPNVKIRRFECVHDYVRVHEGKQDKFHLRQRFTNNNTVLSMMPDEQLWDATAKVEIESHAEVDVYVNCGQNYVQPICKEVASRFWVDDKTRIAEEQQEAFPSNAVDEVVISATFVHHTEHLFDPAYFRTRGEGELDQDEKRQQVLLARHVGTFWPFLFACGWVPTQFAKLLFITPDREGKLVPEGMEHEYVLPMHASEFVNMVDNGSVASRKVFTVNRASKCMITKEGLVTPNEIFPSWKAKDVFASSQGKPVVFFCDGTGGDCKQSMLYAREYVEWKQHRHPKCKQRVLVLKRGLWGLKEWAQETGRKDWTSAIQCMT